MIFLNVDARSSCVNRRTGVHMSAAPMCQVCGLQITWEGDGTPPPHMIHEGACPERPQNLCQVYLLLEGWCRRNGAQNPLYYNEIGNTLERASSVLDSGRGRPRRLATGSKR